MSLNFETLHPVFNNMAIKLAIILFVPLFIGLFVKIILMKVMKESFAGKIAALVMLFCMYQTFKLVVG